MGYIRDSGKKEKFLGKIDVYKQRRQSGTPPVRRGGLTIQTNEYISYFTKQTNICCLF